MLLFRQIFSHNRLSRGVIIAHIQLGNLDELTRFGHQLQHFHHMFFLFLLRIRVGRERHMHLTSDAIYPRFAVFLPFFNPMNQAFELLVVVPIRLKVIVVDEEFQLSGIAIVGSKAPTGSSNGRPNIVDIAQIVLPIEIVLGVIGRHSAALSRLKVVPSVAILVFSGDRFIDNVPCRHVTVDSFHHFVNPCAHGCRQNGLFLVVSKRNSVGFLHRTNFYCL